MRTITYYLATNQVVESDAIYPNAFSADDNTTQLIFDYTGTACATWDKWLDLTMSDYTKDVQSLGTGTVVTFNLGAEHTKKGLLQVNPYAKSGTDKHGFPIYKLTIERQLNNSTVDASAQQSMIDYFDDRLTVKAVSATTLAPGESATASVTTEADGTTYVFGIPQGAQGIQGIQGEKGDMGEVSTAQLNAGLATKADKLYATNLVTNGDFSNGTTGWSANGGALSVASNVLSHTASGTLVEPSAVQNYAFVSGRKYFIKALARVTNASCLTLKITLQGASLDVVQSYSNPSINTWYSFSSVYTTSGDETSVRFYHSYADGAIATGKVMEVKYVLVADLTAIFGAGKEPSAIQMDNMLSTFTNSWFNGTAELVSIANLAQLKADKTQEAWITPTLLNGWVNRLAERPFRYRKDGFGIVHLSGQVKNGTLMTVIASLPSGYRPNIDSVFAVATYSATGSTASAEITIYVANGNIEVSRGSTVWVSLDGVTFSTT